MFGQERLVRPQAVDSATAACTFTAMPAGDFTPHSRALGALSGLGWGLLRCSGRFNHKEGLKSGLKRGREDPMGHDGRAQKTSRLN